MTSEKRNDVAQTLNYITFPFLRNSPWHRPFPTFLRATEPHSQPSPLQSPGILCVYAQGPWLKENPRQPCSSWAGLHSQLHLQRSSRRQGERQIWWGMEAVLVLSPPETRWRKDDSHERLGTGSLLPVECWMVDDPEVLGGYG